MENKVLSNTVPAPPVTRYYQKNNSSEIAIGRALTKNGQGEIPRIIVDFKCKGSKTVVRLKL
jgi:hypothetical protein